VGALVAGSGALQAPNSAASTSAMQLSFNLFAGASRGCAQICKFAIVMFNPPQN
jgi:hypothetical protein